MADEMKYTFYEKSRNVKNEKSNSIYKNGGEKFESAWRNLAEKSDFSCKNASKKIKLKYFEDETSVRKTTNVRS